MREKPSHENENWFFTNVSTIFTLLIKQRSRPINFVFLKLYNFVIVR